MVAMSGGVDSSVSACLLQRQGYEVVGVTLQLWPGGGSKAGGCCGWSAVNDARRVAGRLGIPHYVLNFRSIFEEQVVDYFCREYLRGRTPNPCISCNRHIKFGALLEQAESLGMDYLATGHYARIQSDPGSGRLQLRRGVDRKKDQSYVLYHLTQRQLARLKFPLGELTKEQVRAIAREAGLAVAGKPESQEICFIPDNDHGCFVAARHPQEARPGPIIDVDGRVLGQHRGLQHYTIGQRRGLGIAAPRPLYVVGLDAGHNAVIVGDQSLVWRDRCTAADLNFIAVERLEREMAVMAKIRYSAEPAAAVISPCGEDLVEVRFQRPVRAITPGQAVVFYQDDLVIGGGVIDKS